MKIRTSQVIVVMIAVTLGALLGIIEDAAGADRFVWTHEWFVDPGPPVLPFFDEIHVNYAFTGGTINDPPGPPPTLTLDPTAGFGVINSPAGNDIRVQWAPSWLIANDWFIYEFSVKSDYIEVASIELWHLGAKIADVWPDGTVTNLAGANIGHLPHILFRQKIKLPGIPQGKEKLADAIERWGDALNNVLPDPGPGGIPLPPAPGNFFFGGLDMAGQYWPDATLLPTVATKWALYKNIPLFGTGCVGANADDEIIHNYFDCKFLPGRPKLRSINEWHFTILTPTLASVQGTYIFDKPLQIIRARFTYVLEKRKNEPDWYIIQHHSSIANYDAEPFGPIEQRPGPPAPPDPLPCPWDFNGDGVVNWHDLLELVDNWGPCPDDETVGADANVGVIGGQLHESKESENKK